MGHASMISMLLALWQENAISICVIVFEERNLEMLQCRFELNDQPMSKFIAGASSFPAFSGLGKYANVRKFVCSPSVGAIPPGRYYIIDRQSGGLLGPIRDMFSQRSEWFALYAAD